jgi:hypothetical protein
MARLQTRTPAKVPPMVRICESSCAPGPLGRPTSSGGEAPPVPPQYMQEAVQAPEEPSGGYHEPPQLYIQEVRARKMRVPRPALRVWETPHHLCPVHIPPAQPLPMLIARTLSPPHPNVSTTHATGVIRARGEREGRRVLLIGQRRLPQPPATAPQRRGHDHRRRVPGAGSQGDGACALF